MKKAQTYKFNAYKPPVDNAITQDRSFYDPIKVEVMSDNRKDALKEAKRLIDDPDRNLVLEEVREI